MTAGPAAAVLDSLSAAASTTRDAAADVLQSAVHTVQRGRAQRAHRSRRRAWLSGIVAVAGVVFVVVARRRSSIASIGAARKASQTEWVRGQQQATGQTADQAGQADADMGDAVMDSTADADVRAARD